MNSKNLIITCFTILVIVSSSSLFAQLLGAKVGSFDTLSDIGSPGFEGEAVYTEPSQKYNLKGSGYNIWFEKDSFSFLSKKMNGDFIVQTRLKFIGDGHEPHRKAGIMLRTSDDPSSPMTACTIHGDGSTALQFRREAKGNVDEIKFVTIAPDIFQLEKKGDSIIMSVAHFGEVYETQTLENLELGKTLNAGLFICSHNDEFIEEAEFSNVRIFNTAPDSLVQYKDYLGSLLEIMDVESGHRQVLAGYSGSWQAPNWTPDGKTLIYNSEGLLYNFDIASKKSTILNTDFAVNNNNDHILTFDGKQIGISNHVADKEYRSIIFTLPVTGGIPKRITEKGPSYLHGWSPDNKYLIYTAERNGQYDLYRISAEGGEEEQLTDEKGLDDGSEYSPDGKNIYFNSTRTGTMQIWRMDADGDNQIQLTFDELNDWFPHVSPDNKWLVFVSFPKEVPANSHPFYERVYLRLMPIEGGQPKVIAYLYGGQGTMNVPSWSPDSKKIAFISNGIFD